MDTSIEKDMLKTEIETYNQVTFKKCCHEAGVTLIGFTQSPLDGYVVAEVKYNDVIDLYWLGRLYGVNRLTSKK